MTWENIIGNKIKVSYFRYTNNERAERFIIGELIQEEQDLIHIKGLVDGRIFIINKANIIELTMVGDEI